MSLLSSFHNFQKLESVSKVFHLCHHLILLKFLQLYVLRSILSLSNRVNIMCAKYSTLYVLLVLKLHNCLCYRSSVWRTYRGDNWWIPCLHIIFSIFIITATWWWPFSDMLLILKKCEMCCDWRFLYYLLLEFTWDVYSWITNAVKC